jgi:hypothetical protein
MQEKEHRGIENVGREATSGDGKCRKISRIGAEEMSEDMQHRRRRNVGNSRTWRGGECRDRKNTGERVSQEGEVRESQGALEEKAAGGNERRALMSDSVKCIGV